MLTLGLLGCTSGPEAESRSAVSEAAVDTGQVAASPDASVSDVEHGVLFFGNSITAGYGVEPEEAFPAYIEDKIDSLGWTFEVVSAGFSGETSAGGLRRIDWVMNEGIDVMVLELGGNDGLRGVPVKTTKQNLAGIIDSARAINPDVRILLAGMQVPPNLGQQYTRAFRNIYPDLAAEKNVELIPFLLEGVGGVPELNQSDGIHPTAEGHRIIARTVWDYLKPVLVSVNTQTTLNTLIPLSPFQSSI